MAKRKRDWATRSIGPPRPSGHALGSVVGTIESLQAQHPHPVDEAREALAAGQERLAAATSRTSTRRHRDDQEGEALARRPKKGRHAPDERTRGRGPRDTHGAEDGEAREEGRQARSEEPCDALRRAGSGRPLA